MRPGRPQSQMDSYKQGSIMLPNYLTDQGQQAVMATSLNFPEKTRTSSMQSTFPCLRINTNSKRKMPMPLQTCNSVTKIFKTNLVSITPLTLSSSDGHNSEKLWICWITWSSNYVATAYTYFQSALHLLLETIFFDRSIDNNREIL